MKPTRAAIILWQGGRWESVEIEYYEKPCGAPPSYVYDKEDRYECRKGCKGTRFWRAGSIDGGTAIYRQER